MTFRFKLALLGIGLTTLPLTLFFGLTSFEFGNLTRQAEVAILEKSEAELDAELRAIIQLVQTQEALMETSIRRSTEAVDHLGGIVFEAEGETAVPWQAVNQFTKQAHALDLPRVTTGQGEWLQQVTDPRQPVPVIDQISVLTGYTATLFQRMNAAGDMLRVATSVIKKDGTRAIGTYIPARQPDGSKNPVLAKVLAGQAFHGRAFVVDQWYLTSYEPLFDAQRNVVGIFYIGAPEAEATQEIRERIMRTEIGQTGYAFALRASGPEKGQYIVSKDGVRDGENVLETKDADGDYVVQHLISQAMALSEGETAQHSYRWQNPGDQAPQSKIVQYAYNPEWSWVICVGANQDEFLKPVVEMKATSSFSMRLLLGIGGVTILAAVCLFIWFARQTGQALETVSSQLNEVGEATLSAANETNQASQSLAETSNQQAAGLEETNAAVQELTGQTQQNAHEAARAREQMGAAGERVTVARTSMEQLTASMEEIAAMGRETEKIVKTIDEIAFQTNILALNAAVEAARAGEAGAGFAVVADEVRNLALRAAQAAKDTSALIESSLASIESGKGYVTATHDAFRQVEQSTRRVGELVSEINQASDEQKRGVEQINTAVNEMDRVTQASASSAEESAAAAEELNAQAAVMKGLVDELLKMVRRDTSATLSSSRVASGHATEDTFTMPAPAQREQSTAVLNF